jgi:hypothetical protein
MVARPSGRANRGHVGAAPVRDLPAVTDRVSPGELVMKVGA